MSDKRAGGKPMPNPARTSGDSGERTRGRRINLRSVRLASYKQICGLHWAGRLADWRTDGRGHSWGWHQGPQAGLRAPARGSSLQSTAPGAGWWLSFFRAVWGDQPLPSSLCRAIPQISLTSPSYFPLTFLLCKHLSLFFPLPFFGGCASSRRL